MQISLSHHIGALAVSSALLFAAQAQGSENSESAHEHSTQQHATHGHSTDEKGHSQSHGDAHKHDHGSDDIYRGYFDDSQVSARTLADWEGDWQSVYPLLQNGTLSPVMEHKARQGDKTVAQYHAYYNSGYQTDVERILIRGDSVSFYKGGEPVQAVYGRGRYEILTYEAGNRGVRYIFEKAQGDAAAPAFMLFSDHRISPAKADHYHLYWGNDLAALLQQMSNWPTYYPASLSGAEIASEMMAN